MLGTRRGDTFFCLLFFFALAIDTIETRADSKPQSGSKHLAYAWCERVILILRTCQLTSRKLGDEGKTISGGTQLDIYFDHHTLFLFLLS